MRLFDLNASKWVLCARMSIYISFVTIQNGNLVFSTTMIGKYFQYEANKSLRKYNCRKMQTPTTMPFDT